MKQIIHSSFMKYVAAWIALPFIAIFNGMLRELTYNHMVGDHRAHQISSIILSAFILFYVLILNSRISLRSNTLALAVGSIWLFLTIIFEFILGLILNIPLTQQIESYNLGNGNLWVVVLLSVLLSPLLLRRQKMQVHAG